MGDAIKWAILAAVLGVSNTGTYQLFARPEIQNVQEMQSATAVLSEQLKACYAQLDECYANCR